MCSGKHITGHFRLTGKQGHSMSRDTFYPSPKLTFPSERPFGSQSQIFRNATSFKATDTYHLPHDTYYRYVPAMKALSLAIHIRKRQRGCPEQRPWSNFLTSRHRLLGVATYLRVPCLYFFIFIFMTYTYQLFAVICLACSQILKKKLKEKK